MAATIKYKNGYPSATQPIESSSAIASTGLVTGSATFLVSEGEKPFSANNAISPKYFSSLNGIQLSGLYVESAEYDKKAGLNYCRLQVIGAVRLPQIVKTSEYSLRSFSKTEQFVITDSEGNKDTKDVFYSFDYYSESITWSWVYIKDYAPNVDAPVEASFGPKFNERGGGSLVQITGPGMPPAQTPQQLVSYSKTFLRTKTLETRGNVVTKTETVVAVYQ